MSVSFFAIRVEPYCLVAAEISDVTVAVQLDAGRCVFYGTPDDLSRLAHRLNRALVTISRGSTGSTAASRPRRRAEEPAVVLRAG